MMVICLWKNTVLCPFFTCEYSTTWYKMEKNVLHLFNNNFKIFEKKKFHEALFRIVWENLQSNLKVALTHQYQHQHPWQPSLQTDAYFCWWQWRMPESEGHHSPSVGGSGQMNVSEISWKVHTTCQNLNYLLIYILDWHSFYRRVADTGHQHKAT